jgi:hypothetical protein
MRTERNSNRATANPSPGLKNRGSILSRIVTVLFLIAVTMLIKKAAQNDSIRRWLRRLFPKFFSQTHETTIDV